MDAACGIGAPQLATLQRRIGSSLPLTIANAVGDGALNEGCEAGLSPPTAQPCSAAPQLQPSRPISPQPSAPPSSMEQVWSRVCAEGQETATRPRVAAE